MVHDLSTKKGRKNYYKTVTNKSKTSNKLLTFFKNLW